MNQAGNMRTRPEITIPESIEIPMPQKFSASNGIELYALKNSGQKVVRLSIVMRAGSSYQRVPFSASATLNMLSEGSEEMSSQQIAMQLDYFGSYFEVSADRDYAVITFCCLDKFFTQTMRLVEQIVLYPVFPDKELRTYCDKRRQELGIERSKAAIKARELFAQKLFGAQHPYGISSPECLYDNLSREHLQEFYNRHYTAESCFMVCSIGHDAQIDAILRLAEKIPASENSEKRIFPAPDTSPYGFALQADAVQSAIRIGRRLFPRSHPDFIGMQVVATALGGYFGSRLVQNLREKRGYTYGVLASMVNLEKDGYIAIATQVGANVTKEAVEQIFCEMERLRTAPIGNEELACVRNMIYGEIMRILDGPFGIVDVTIENIQNGTDNNETDRMIRQIRNIGPDRIAQLCSQYLIADTFTTVVAGPEESDLQRL